MTDSATRTPPRKPADPKAVQERMSLSVRAEKAIESRNPVDLVRCIDLGFDPNSYIGQGLERPALISACSAGSWHCVEVLLQRGADPKRAVTSTGVTPLRLVSTRGHVGAARLLLEAGDDPNAVGEPNKRSAIHIAAENGFVNLIELMDRHCGNMLLKDVNGDTPLHLANKRYQALDWIARRAPEALNMTNDEGRTPLMAAIFLRLDKSALALLEHDQDLSLSVADGKGAMELAKAYGLNDVADRIQTLENARRANDALAAIREMAAARTGSSAKPPKP